MFRKNQKTEAFDGGCAPAVERFCWKMTGYDWLISMPVTGSPARS